MHVLTISIIQHMLSRDLDLTAARDLRSNICTGSAEGRTYMTRLGLIAAAVLLASTGLAVAQSSNSSSSPNDVSASQGKCWDSVANQVRDQSTQGSEAGRSSTGSSTASGNTSAGTGTSVGAGSSSSGGTGSSGGTTGSLAGASGSSGTGGTSSTGTASSSGSGSSGSGTGSTNRPAEAMGLPDCRS